MLVSLLSALKACLRLSVVEKDEANSETKLCGFDLNCCCPFPRQLSDYVLEKDT